MGEQLTDQILVERAQQGDKKAFNLLVARYQNKVAGLLTRYVSANDIPDVAQETFIKAYRSLDTFRGESAFYTWLYRIAVNTAKNYLMTQGRRPPTEDVLAEDAESFDVGTKLRNIDTPEHLILSDELKEIVFKTINELPDELKTAITLRELEGMSYEEIADVMDCPVGTVRSRIFRAREFIENQLAPLVKH
ncbi:RNA polymerase sigma factor RpoE [Gallibacterium anatis]|uniref:RNA polymerase sigma factor n=3 Tax=Gallibacterium anatis TaxID=750 RepID=A0A0A2Y940_9PAST|nr:RNA polymerase sigma factor RpoE [Gallibacterium anatis]AEC17677.1 RNA polymerase sigma factor AlgU [Gallibacterium anatis UMN179]KGQ24954.1 RNA polymerase sigma factor RpoE [Gallibacterium anatis]KGQ27059.1 RNA polymerase sigma factor RpoE [Gallibacterium anatis CCM5995]KGQ27845.1 RNA polymerase sigma factor RpoE [Gallibacterium anatis]KGQ32882.1 RNA polymerase sigma factor RpoE [Gallibacterium anatis]